MRFSFNNLSKIVLTPTKEVKSYLGFCRNYYNGTVFGNDPYALMNYLDSKQKRNIEANIENDLLHNGLDISKLKLKRKKEGTLFQPVNRITITVKNGIASIVITSKFQYNFPVASIKNGTYTNCAIYQKAKDEPIYLLIDKQWKYNKENKRLSAKSFEKRKESKLKKAIKTLKKDSFKTTNVDELKTKFVMNISEFMIDINKFKCVHKSDIPNRYYEFIKALDVHNSFDILDNENQVFKKYQTLTDTIKLEFKNTRFYNFLCRLL